MKKRIGFPIAGILFAGALVSLLFPYLKMTDRNGLLEIIRGYEMISPAVALVFFLTAAMMVYFSLAWIWPFSLSLINLLIVWMVRSEIHFQGYDFVFDYKSDTQSGIGYHVLFLTSAGFVAFCTLQMVYGFFKGQKSS